MAASARVAYLARRASDYGVETGPVKVNLAQVRERKQKVVERFRNGAEQCLETTANLDVIRGEASFIDARTVKVEGSGYEALRLSGEKIFINTGASRSSLRSTDSIECRLWIRLRSWSWTRCRNIS